MKNIARGLVQVHYKEQLNPTFDHDHNSRDVQDKVAENIDDLLYDKKSLFHVGPCDENVSYT